MKSPRALSFLEERGFRDPEEVAVKYAMGLAPGKEDRMQGFVGRALASRDRLGFESVEMLERGLVAAGLASPRGEGEGLRDFFYSRLVLPVSERSPLSAFADGSAQISGFCGRLLSDAGSAPKWLNTPETALFRRRKILFGASWAVDAIRASRSAILVEGNFDVIQLREGGFATAVAALGTSLTEEQVARLPESARGRPLQVTIAADSDAPGRKSALRSAEMFFRLRPDAIVHIARCPDGMDPDDLIRNRGPAAFQQVLEGATTPLARVLADREGAEGLRPSLPALLDVLQLSGPLLSREPASRLSDLDHLHAWVGRVFGAVIPLHTLRRLVDAGAGGSQ